MVDPPTVRVVRGDARDLSFLSDGSVGLVVTSPPYPMIPMWDSLFASWGAREYDAMHTELARAWAECYRVLVPGGLLALNIGDAVRSTTAGFRLWPNHTRVTELCERAGFVPLPSILWKKPTNKPNAFLGSGFLPPNAYVTMDCEHVLLFRKGALRSFPRADPARRESVYTRRERDRWFSQVWEGIRGVRQANGTDRRTAAFPPEVPHRLIAMFSVRGDTVLDPFAGSGTTLRAAVSLERSAIGVELDPSLCARLEDWARKWSRGPRAGERSNSTRRAVGGGRSPRRRRA